MRFLTWSLITYHIAFFKFYAEAEIIGSNEPTSSRVEDLESILQGLERIFKSKQNDFVLWGMRNLNDPCVEELLELFKAISTEELWALKFLDASSKVQSGILDYNFISMGSFDECVKIRNRDESIKGKFCLTKLSGPDKNESSESLMQVDLIGALCVPDKCSVGNITTILNLGMPDSIKKTFSLEMMEESTCATDKKPDLTIGDRIFLYLVLTILALVFICTAIEVTTLKTCSKTRAFSLYSNSQKLFSMSNENKTSITCLNGLRVILIAWIVLGHRLHSTSYLPIFINNAALLEYMLSIPGQILWTLSYPVDTFLLISGLLVTTKLLKTLKKTNGKISIGTFYLHRYIRLTTLLAFVTFFVMTLLEHFSNGPLWKYAIDSIFLKHCMNSWWTSLMYFQNYLAPQDLCISPSWYLSVDMQLYLISPVLLYILWKSKVMGFTLLLIGLVATHLLGIRDFWVYEFSQKTQAMPASSLQRDAFKKYYVQTHTRAAPWIMGVLLGYFMLKTANVKKLHKGFVAVMWIVSTICIASIFTFSYLMVQEDYEYNKVAATCFGVFSRTAWTFAFCWCIYACHMGYGGVLNWFLSLKIWIPLSRLCYGIYLIHRIVQTVHVGQMQTNMHFSYVFVIFSFVADFVISTILAAVIYLCVEAPVFEMEAALKGSGPKRNRSTTQIREHIS